MERKKLIKIIAPLIFLIFVVNFLANKFYWYYSIWYFDMIMHTVGGFWLGLAVLFVFPARDTSIKGILKILGIVLAVGVAWELYEVVFYNIYAGNPFNTLDSLSDLFFDLTGGTAALLYFFKNIMLVEQSEHAENS